MDANVSVASLHGKEVNSSKVELKNLNSLKALNRGIQQEIERQVNVIESGGIVMSETRTYDTRLGLTLPLRAKEDTVDYRFVPDPNLPPLKLDRTYIESIKGVFDSRKATKTSLDEPAERRVQFEIEDSDEIRELCLDLIKKMKNISKRYARDGQSRHMFMMLDKLCETTNDKVDVYAAMRILDELLRTPQSKVK